MLMCKQMILAILVISVAFGAETKFQIRIIHLCSAADRAFMLGHARPGRRLAHLALKGLPPVNFLWGNPSEISGGEIKHQEIQKRHNNRHSARPVFLNQAKEDQRAVYPRKPFHLNRNNKV